MPAYGKTSNIIEIFRGKSRVIKTDFDIVKVATGDEDICLGTKTSDREVLINAKSVGKSNIIVWGPKGKRKEVIVIVKSRDLTDCAAGLRVILRNIEGVKVKIVGGRIVLEGEVFTKRDFDKLGKIIEDIPEVINLVELSPLMKKIVKEEIEKALMEEGLKSVKVKVGKNKFMLVGSVKNEQSAKRAELIALAFSPDVLNIIEVYTETEEDSRMIEMTLTVMEIDKNVLKDIGVHWNPGGNLDAYGGYTGNTGNKASLSGAITGTISNLFPKMRKIKENGKGRSLMQQVIITKSGGEAKFFAGTEIPISVAQEGGTMSVEYKKVGVTLHFSPNINIRNNIISPIKIESSTITGEGSGGAPIVSSTELSTLISVKPGNSIALGGLIGQREAMAISGSPLDSGTSLFQANIAKKRERKMNEVLIFITPKILASSEGAVKEMREKIEDKFKEQELENLRKKMEE